MYSRVQEDGHWVLAGSITIVSRADTLHTAHGMLNSLTDRRGPPPFHPNYYLKALRIYLSLIVRETTQKSDYKVDLGNVTVFNTWKRRLERIESKLHDVANEMHT